MLVIVSPCDFDNLRSLALVDGEGDLIETADLSKFNSRKLFDEFDQVGDKSHLKHRGAPTTKFLYC